MRFGDVNVSNALARNPGARFSECGYATLVGRAERDEGLAEKLGVRLDIPGSLLRELIGKVADVVRARFLTAPRPVARGKTQNSAAATARRGPEGDRLHPGAKRGRCAQSHRQAQRFDRQPVCGEG